MKSEVFASGLAAFAALLDPSNKRSIMLLTAAFEALGSSTVKSALTKFRNSQPSAETTSWGQPRDCPLSGLSDILAVYGAKAAIGDLELLLEVLNDYSELSFQEFANKLQKANEKKTKSQKKIDPINTSLVREYATALENTTLKPCEFASVFSRLKADKRLRLQMELTNIANEFYGTDLRYKTKNEALKVIQRRHLQDRRLSEEDRDFRAS